MKSTVEIIRVQEASNDPKHKGLLRVTVVDASIAAADRKPENFIGALHSMLGKDGKPTEAKKEFVRKLIEASKPDENGVRVTLDVQLTNGTDDSMWLNPDSFAIDNADDFLAKF